MANFEGTQNTMSQKTGTPLTGDVQVWARVDKVAHLGRLINLDDYEAGDLIPAGTGLIFTSNQYAEIVDIATASNEKLAQVNCLSYNDVRIPDGCIRATIAGVEAGKIWAEAAGISEEKAALLTGLHGNIDFIYALKAE
jgi:hypothetical protein